MSILNLFKKKSSPKSGKVLIEMDLPALSELIREVFKLSPTFSKTPSYIIKPNSDQTWSIVGLSDPVSGSNYYPSTLCQSCGEIESINVTPNVELQLFEVYCQQCSNLCNYVRIYNPHPQTISQIVEKTLAGETF